MKKRQIIAALVKCANDFDSIGYHTHADYLTKIAQEFAFPEQDEFLPGREEMMRQGDDLEDSNYQDFLDLINGGSDEEDDLSSDKIQPFDNEPEGEDFGDIDDSGLGMENTGIAQDNFDPEEADFQAKLNRLMGN